MPQCHLCHNLNKGAFNKGACLAKRPRPCSILASADHQVATIEGRCALQSIGATTNERKEATAPCVQ